MRVSPVTEGNQAGEDGHPPGHTGSVTHYPGPDSKSRLDLPAHPARSLRTSLGALWEGDIWQEVADHPHWAEPELQESIVWLPQWAKYRAKREQVFPLRRWLISYLGLFLNVSSSSSI